MHKIFCRVVTNPARSYPKKSSTKKKYILNWKIEYKEPVIVCPICGKEFIARPASRLTCSFECAAERNRRLTRSYQNEHREIIRQKRAAKAELKKNQAKVLSLDEKARRTLVTLVVSKARKADKRIYTPSKRKVSG